MQHASEAEKTPRLLGRGVVRGTERPHPGGGTRARTRDDTPPSKTRNFWGVGPPPPRRKRNFWGVRPPPAEEEAQLLGGQTPR